MGGEEERGGVEKAWTDKGWEGGGGGGQIGVP